MPDEEDAGDCSWGHIDKFWKQKWIPVLSDNMSTKIESYLYLVSMV